MKAIPKSIKAISVRDCPHLTLNRVQVPMMTVWRCETCCVLFTIASTGTKNPEDLARLAKMEPQ